ncbi:Uncharacterized protein FWK35_00008330 [Aphis craccivora]|uniref:Uncharacterized protein n=1 Tax=Aphis craccivora TaxID=307492 RepID=A0A6G0YV83_APHCR|nr:Uncharacterized protein FWK35_00008330 [Aphis craccivora]
MCLICIAYFCFRPIHILVGINNMLAFLSALSKTSNSRKKFQIDQHAKSLVHEKCLNKSFSKPAVLKLCSAEP